MQRSGGRRRVSGESSGSPSTGLDLPGTSGNFLSVPDSAALDITGDIDIRAHCALDDWSNGAYQVLVAKWDGSAGAAYMLVMTATGHLELWWNNGAVVLTKTSTVPTGLSNGAVKWVRSTLDADNGAVGNDVTFYVSDDGSSWAPVGDPVTTAATTQILSTASTLAIGANDHVGTPGAANLAAGEFYRAQVLNGIGGSVVLDVNLVGVAVVGTRDPASFAASTGQTVTANGSGWDWIT